jgi:hypothetical protein
MKSKLSCTVGHWQRKTPVHKFTYKGLGVEIHADEVFTALIRDSRPGMMPEVMWSLNTHRPRTLRDAIRGAKDIIDNPPAVAHQ